MITLSLGQAAILASPGWAVKEFASQTCISGFLLIVPTAANRMLLWR